jgi:hypothetical protein
MNRSTKAIRPRTKWLAIEVAMFVLGLQLEAQDIKKGKSSYRRFLPDDANWWERYANNMALRKGSIIKQAAAKDGKTERQILRYLAMVKRERWFDEVKSRFEGDTRIPVEWPRYVGARRTPEHFMTFSD